MTRDPTKKKLLWIMKDKYHCFDLFPTNDIYTGGCLFVCKFQGEVKGF